MSGPLAIGPHQSVREPSGTEMYEILTGDRYLHGLEDGDVRCFLERHVFILNDETGDILVSGDHGTFAGRWTERMRGGRTLKRFLASVSFDYFMTKTSAKPHEVADIDATIEHMRREVLRDRRRGHIDRKRAADVWRAIADELDAGQNEDEFVRAIYDDADLYRYFMDGDPPYIARVPHGGLMNFWNNVWSVFRKDVLLRREDEGVDQAAQAA